MRLKSFLLFISMSALALTAGVGCKKKDRLTASTFQFSITPPAATVVKGHSLILTARSSNGVDLNPNWSLSSATLGTLNTSLGPQVILQTQGLGDLTVTAADRDLITTAQIAIVTHNPTSTPSTLFDVYNDNGLPDGNSDIFKSIVPPFAIATSNAGYAAEGLTYLRATSASTGDFWLVTLDKNSTGIERNLSSFSAGSLKFALRLGRVMSGTESIRIDIQDNATTRSFFLISGSNGFSRFSVDWQEISIPISGFGGVNLARIKVPFAIVTALLSSTLTFDVDAVRWDRS